MAAYRAGGLSEREVGVQTPNFWNNNFSHRHGGRFANRITPRSKGQRDSILSVSKFCRSVDYYYYSKQDGICNGPGIGVGGLFSLKESLPFFLPCICAGLMYIIDESKKDSKGLRVKALRVYCEVRTEFFLIFKCTMSFGERHVTFILWCFGIYTISKNFQVINVIKNLKNWKKFRLMNLSFNFWWIFQFFFKFDFIFQ